MSTEATVIRDLAPATEIDYVKTLQQLGRNLDALLEYSQKLGLKNSVGMIEEVVTRMREHRFTVAVVGEFKTGKSTFVNALLGVDVVPTDVIPATATLNRITFGMDSSIEVVYKDGHKDKVAFDELSKYVTKEHVTEDLLKNVDEVVIYYQAPYLLNNVDIIDTPGLNDEEAMTSVTLSVLPKADAAILVISAMAPLSEYTRDFLENKLLSADLGRVIFVVNRIGQVGGPEDADRLIRHIETRIAQKVVERAKAEHGENSPQFEAYVKKIGKPRVFGIDSYQALQAQLRAEGALLERSRFTAFSSGLRKFLNEDRGAIVLQVPVNRAIASASEILLCLDVRRKALSMSASEFQVKYEDAAKKLDQLSEQRVAELRVVDEKQAAALAACLPRVSGAQQRIVQSMAQAVEAVEIKDAELSTKEKQEQAIQKLRNAAQAAARRQAEKELNEVAAVVTRSISEASGKLERFTSHVDDVLRQIASGFTGVESSQDDLKGIAATVAAGAMLGGSMIAFGGIWSGYKQAGLAGAVAGGVASLATTTLATMVLIAAGAPVTLPVAVALSLLGWFSGDKATRYIFGGARAKQFKEHFRAKLDEYVKGQNIEAEMRQTVEQYVAEAFGSLKDTVAREVDGLIENTRRTLEDLRAKRERHEITTGEELEMYAQMARKAESIRDNAARVNAALIQRMAM